MKLRAKSLVMWLVILGVGGLLSAQLLGVFADSNYNMYLTPASQTLAAGQSFTAAVRISVKNNAYQGYETYVKAYLTFPADKLAVTGVSTAGNPYQIHYDKSYSNSAGTIHIEEESPYSYSPDQFVANITFKVIGTGTAAVNFTSESNLSNQRGNGLNELGGTTGGSYTLPNPPAAQPPPTPSPTAQPKPATTPSSNSAAKSVAPSTQPVASMPNVTPASTDSGVDTSVGYDYGYDYAILVWHAPSLATAEVHYGFDATHLDSVYPISKPQTDFEVTIPGLQPGRDYSFRIVATDSSKRQINYQGNFTTKGYPVEVKVVTSSKQPIKNAQVHIRDDTQKTPSSGTVSVSLPSGPLDITANADKKSKTFNENIQALTIPADGSAPATQKLTLIMDGVTQFTPLQVGGAILLIIALPVAAFGYTLLKKGRARRLANGYVLNEEDTMPVGVKPSAVKVTEPVEPKPKTYPAITKHYDFKPDPTPKPFIPEVEPSPPKPVPKKPNALKPEPVDEPADMFEAAEERFEHDDRLKNFREPPKEK